ncbi:MAG: hypothetical protein QXI11_06180 [Thermoproteota archaeon]
MSIIDRLYKNDDSGIRLKILAVLTMLAVLTAFIIIIFFKNLKKKAMKYD